MPNSLQVSAMKNCQKIRILHRDKYSIQINTTMSLAYIMFITLYKQITFKKKKKV